MAKLAFKPRGVALAGAGGAYGDVSRGGWGIVGDEKVREVIEKNAWPVFASLSWAAVMWLFWWHPDVVQPSLRSSMNYMWVLFLGVEAFMLTIGRYVDSDKWDGLRNFLWHNK
jgi:hypothetical protein